MKTIRSNLTYANVMSTIAVFLLLGGGAAFAATKLGKNSVGTKQIKNNAVTTAKIKNRAVTEAKIAAGAVTGAQVKSGSLTGTQINAATLGTVPNATQATTATTAINASNATTVNGHTAECKSGTQLFGGSCWDSAPRPAATQPAAAAACTGLGGTLPSASDLVAFSKVATLSAGDEWTDEINTVTAENVYTVITVGPTGNINLDGPGDTKEYHCVVPLVR